MVWWAWVNQLKALKAICGFPEEKEDEDIWPMPKRSSPPFLTPCGTHTHWASCSCPALCATWILRVKACHPTFQQAQQACTVWPLCHMWHAHIYIHSFHCVLCSLLKITMPDTPQSWWSSVRRAVVLSGCFQDCGRLTPLLAARGSQSAQVEPVADGTLSCPSGQGLLLWLLRQLPGENAVRWFSQNLGYQSSCPAGLVWGLAWTAPPGEGPHWLVQPTLHSPFMGQLLSPALSEESNEN